MGSERPSAVPTRSNRLSLSAATARGARTARKARPSQRIDAAATLGVLLALRHEPDTTPARGGEAPFGTLARRECRTFAARCFRLARSTLLRCDPVGLLRAVRDRARPGGLARRAPAP